MQDRPFVVLKGRKDGIVVELNEDADMAALKKQLRKKVADAKQFFEGASAKVMFTGRSLAEDEERALLDIIFTETTLDIPFVEQEGFTAANPAFVTDTAPSHLSRDEQPTMYYHGGLRSGQSIRYHGSVVVLGDVNPGSEIVAGGHVIVLGALKGFVHAGCNGDANCFVSASVLLPTQLRIANIITVLPTELRGSRKQAKKAAYAYIQDGQVYIAPLVNG